MFSQAIKRRNFASMLLHFALVLHFAAFLITFCVNITFCGDYYILRRNTGLLRSKCREKIHTVADYTNRC